MTETETLLPCPFCGGRANIYTNEVDFVTKWSVGCGDCNCNMDVCEDTPADAAVEWNTRGYAPTPGFDPLAGLAERLDRLCLTSTEDGRRFILATESAHNIVGIVREWIRSGAGAKVSNSSTDRTSGDHK